MRLTDFTDYSLRALIYLNHTKRLSTLTELSGHLGVSRNNLIKVSNRLTKLGYVEATRGPTGGLKIKTETGKTTIGTIVRQTEENFHIAQCFSGTGPDCKLLNGCILKGCLHEALEAFIAALDSHTLNDITPKHF